jgi:hypothetical protein
MASHSNAKLCKRLFAPFRQYLLARLELFAPQIVQFTGAITSFVPTDSSSFDRRNHAARGARVCLPVSLPVRPPF